MTDAILAHLAGLGGDPHTVARNLRRQGLRGRIGCGRTCPVARSLPQPPTGLVTVGLWGVRIYSEIGQDVERIPLPAPVVEFIRRFDAGDYPDLVEAS